MNYQSLPKTLQELYLDTKELTLKIKQSNYRAILQIFQSDDFTPEILIHYFMATFNEPGPHQYLTNRLYHMPKMFVEYFIPQFVYMVIKIGSQSMETFLESLSSQILANYFKISWCLNAYSQDEKNDAKQYTKLESFQRRLEKSIINGAITLNRNEVNNKLDDPKFQEELLRQCKEKEFRSQYVYLLERFLIQMIQLSLTLKLIEPPQRKQYLAEQIVKGNRAISRMKNLNSSLAYYWGIIIPFEREYEHTEASNLMVNISDEGAACFNTKTRVPYRIVIETVSIQEINQKQDEISQNESNIENGENEDFMQMDLPDNLEEQMKKLTNEKHYDSIFNQLIKYDSQSSSFKDFDDLAIVQDANLKKRRSNSWSDNENSQKSEENQEYLSPLKCKDLEDGMKLKQQEEELHNSSSNKLLTPVDSNKQIQQSQLPSAKKIAQKINNNLNPWGEDWKDKFDRIKKKSKFQDFESHKIRVIMIKGGDDLRQELLAMQVIQKMNDIFSSAQLNLYLKPYEIIVTSENSGILEFVQNSISMDGLLKYLEKQKISFTQFFKQYFESNYHQAQKNFVESLAGYSLLCYILQIKDRHNGNILFDNQGHIVHIDFGFILSISPGNAGFERAPFKMTQDYLNIMEGKNSSMFEYFRRLMYSGFMEIRKYCASIFQIIEIMMEKSNFSCFRYFNFTQFKQRFLLNESDLKCRQEIDKLIQNSMDDTRTGYYDKFQYLTNGIYY